MELNRRESYKDLTTDVDLEGRRLKREGGTCRVFNRQETFNKHSKNEI
jgi:hypothetical protein